MGCPRPHDHNVVLSWQRLLGGPPQLFCGCVYPSGSSGSKVCSEALLCRPCSPQGSEVPTDNFLPIPLPVPQGAVLFQDPGRRGGTFPILAPTPSLPGHFTMTSAQTHHSHDRRVRSR